jgi:polysaccharide pyruvyl transferase WcaK-like protein
VAALVERGSESWWERLKDAAGTVRDALDTDVALQGAMAATIELAATRYAVEPGARWSPGQPFRLFFAGYAGTRNTGADVRVEEMIRQIRHVLGDRNCELSISTMDGKLSAGYFPRVRQLLLPRIFPRFVADTVHDVHGVVACEGSMFKSKFASALSTYMVGALGCAAVENKLAVGYGGEAGKMDPSLEALVRRYCRDALILCRNEESRAVLADLGVASESGTDTAWTFDPAPPEVGEAVLRRAGWDGAAPVLVVCPIHPFWWPVKPSVAKGLAMAMSGAYSDVHYSSVYFHKSGDDVDRAQATYLDALAQGLRSFTARHPCFVVIVGMEALDRGACEGLAERFPAPVVVSDEHDHRTMISVLRRARLLLSSRYHAVVCSMPGEVPSAGVTMDERIRNLMADRGTPELCLTVDDPELGPKVDATLERLWVDGPALARGIGRCVVANLQRMGFMGQVFADHVRETHPAFPLRPGLGRAGDPWAHLPPLPPAVEALAAR